jgi:hypothetical protein
MGPFFKNGPTKEILLTVDFNIWDIFHVDLQRKFYLHWIEIWDLTTGTAYRLYLLHPHTASLLLRCIKIVDITKNIMQLLT